MQGTYKDIYEMALRECGGSLFNFPNESAIIHKGFKISLDNNGLYHWKDVRFSDYYEDVDPLITEKVLEMGFDRALTIVRGHNDEDKITSIKMQLINMDNEILFWVKESTKSFTNKNNKISEIRNSKTMSPEAKEKRIYYANKRHMREKGINEKKRGVIKREKERLKLDLMFYENRLSVFKQEFN